MSTDPLQDLTERAAAAVATPPRSRTAAALDELDSVAFTAMLSAVEGTRLFAAASPRRRGVGEILDRLGAVPRHRWLVRRWLDELAGAGLLEGDPGTGYRPTRRAPAAASLANACAGLGYPEEMLRFFAGANDLLPRLVRDEVLVQELLFPDGGFATAETAYRRNLVNRYLNAAVREVFRDAARRAAATGTTLRVVEIGAGVGGTTLDLVPALDGTDVDYLFTDMSSFFLRTARERFADRPWMRFGLLDVNATTAQGHLELDAGWHAVVAANVLHNAHDIHEVLTGLRRALAPGGLVVIVESCREHPQLLTSMHFLMSARPGQPAAGERDRRAGQDRLFLTADEWRAELGDAGLEPIVALPRPGHPLAVLEQHLLVAQAR